MGRQARQEILFDRCFAHFLSHTLCGGKTVPILLLFCLFTNHLSISFLPCAWAAREFRDEIKKQIEVNFHKYSESSRAGKLIVFCFPRPEGISEYEIQIDQHEPVRVSSKQFEVVTFVLEPGEHTVAIAGKPERFFSLAFGKTFGEPSSDTMFITPQVTRVYKYVGARVDNFEGELLRLK